MVSPIIFIKQTREELNQVTWPKRDEVIRLTGIVLIVSIFVGLYIGGLDFALTKLFEVIISK